MLRRVAIVALLICACGGAGEDARAEDALRSCGDADLAASNAFAEAQRPEAHPCVHDSDCLIARRDVRCANGAHFTYCLVARHAEATAAFDAAVAASTRAACTPDTPACMSAGLCPQQRAACTQGVCTAVEP